MRISVLGGTGGTGRETILQGLSGGHRITALARDPMRLDIESSLLEVIKGDALVAKDVDPVVRGQDAVFVSLGLSATYSDDQVVTVCTEGIRNVLASMRRYGVTRLVAMSTHGVNDSDDGSDYVRGLWTSMGERLKDKATMEPLIRASNVDWTIIRAPRISTEPPRGPYRVAERLLIDESSSVSRSLVAQFVLAEIVNPRHVGQAVSIVE